VEREVFDRVMRGRNPDMLIVTTAVGEQRAGCLVGFHSQCSIEPDRYAVWLSKANHTCQLALRATHFGLHFLRSDHGRLAEIFGTMCGGEVDKFTLAPAHPGPFDVPLIEACRDWVVARRTAFLEEGSDHICFIVEPVEACAGEPSSPLRLHEVAHLTPGHDAEERTAREST
jgi:flavin reductase (DIM6/NTAB) family NADH-FMN oxidoreductase RutF